MYYRMDEIDFHEVTFKIEELRLEYSKSCLVINFSFLKNMHHGGLDFKEVMDS